jgi:hypothetical protein
MPDLFGKRGGGTRHYATCSESKRRAGLSIASAPNRAQAEFSEALEQDQYQHWRGEVLAPQCNFSDCCTAAD